MTAADIPGLKSIGNRIFSEPPMHQTGGTSLDITQPHFMEFTEKVFRFDKAYTSAAIMELYKGLGYYDEEYQSEGNMFDQDASKQAEEGILTMLPFADPKFVFNGHRFGGLARVVGLWNIGTSYQMAPTFQMLNLEETSLNLNENQKMRMAQRFGLDRKHMRFAADFIPELAKRITGRTGSIGELGRFGSSGTAIWLREFTKNPEMLPMWSDYKLRPVEKAIIDHQLIYELGALSLDRGHGVLIANFTDGGPMRITKSDGTTELTTVHGAGKFIRPIVEHLGGLVVDSHWRSEVIQQQNAFTRYVHNHPKIKLAIIPLVPEDVQILIAKTKLRAIGQNPLYVMRNPGMIYVGHLELKEQ